MIRVFKCQSADNCNFDNPLLSPAAALQEGGTHLQVLRCFVVAGHQQQLGPDVPQVHVAEQRHALHRGVAGGL